MSFCQFLDFNLYIHVHLEYDEFSEASYFADQAGVFEIRKSNLSPDKKGMVMTQVY